MSDVWWYGNKNFIVKGEFIHEKLNHKQQLKIDFLVGNYKGETLTQNVSITNFMPTSGGQARTFWLFWYFFKDNEDMIVNI